MGYYIDQRSSRYKPHLVEFFCLKDWLLSWVGERLSDLSPPMNSSPNGFDSAVTWHNNSLHHEVSTEWLVRVNRKLLWEVSAHEKQMTGFLSLVSAALFLFALPSQCEQYCCIKSLPSLLIVKVRLDMVNNKYELSRMGRICCFWTRALNEAQSLLNNLGWTIEATRIILWPISDILKLYTYVESGLTALKRLYESFVLGGAIETYWRSKLEGESGYKLVHDIELTKHLFYTLQPCRHFPYASYNVSERFLWD
jgi:hypothetical protein